MGASRSEACDQCQIQREGNLGMSHETLVSANQFVLAFVVFRCEMCEDRKYLVSKKCLNLMEMLKI